MVSVNLIPETVQTMHTRQRHLKLWGVMILASFGLLCIPWGMNWYQSARAEALRVESEGLQGRLKTTRTELRTHMTEANALLLQLQRAKALRSKRAWSGMIGLVGSCMPPGCWLTSLATDPETPTAIGRMAVNAAFKRNPANGSDPKGADSATLTIEAPRKMRLVGYATDAAEPHMFVANLKDTEVFSRVALERSQREPVLDGYYFRFELICEW